MARRIYDDEVRIDTLKDLKRGDRVSISHHGSRYFNTIVTRVHNIECATIVTVRKIEGIPCKRFVGYYNSNFAHGGDESVLTLDTRDDDCVKFFLEKSKKETEKAIDDAAVLYGIRLIREWLSQKNDNT